MIECVPNFSEARNNEVINRIAQSVNSTSAYLLGIDRGEGANRTVFTMAGSPETIFNAAFKAIKTASENIDMRRHIGVHPRLGATDVCPFVPLAGSSMEDCVELAIKLGKKVGDELEIPIYLYGEAARAQNRKNLAEIRQGQYEGLRTRKDAPDFGPSKFNERSGATVIGAREILVAYNVSLDTENLSIAREIARNVRESGYFKKTRSGVKRRIPGKLKSVRAIGWYIKEYECCQVSTNILDYRTTPLKLVFDTIKAEAEGLGVRVKGSEVVGLVPEEALLQPKEDNQIDLVEYLGLNTHYRFDSEEKIIERRLQCLMSEQGKINPE